MKVLYKNKQELSVRFILGVFLALSTVSKDTLNTKSMYQCKNVQRFRTEPYAVE